MSLETDLRPSTAPEFALHANPNPRSDEQRAQLLQSPAFGTQFTDHMSRVTWSEAEGWHSRRVEPYGPIQMNPAASVLHYGQEIFEGLKAYRHADGSVWTFRPEANAARFAASARRLAMPELPTADFIGSIEALVKVEKAWVPSAEETSLYLRPFAYASEVFLGVRPAREIEYLVIASPVGPYFASGVKPVSIWVAEDYHRASSGGTGAAKCGGNYAASLLPQQEAYGRGYDQVCFLDAATTSTLEELGGMNIFVVGADGSIRTPRLTGSILPGITRDSLIQLLADKGQTVQETTITLAELQSGLRDGSIAEVFACGTAAVITPIGKFGGADFELTVGDGSTGPVTAALRAELTDIQYGRAADRHGWMHRLA